MAGKQQPAAAPPYRFRLEAKEPRVFPGGTTREASARNFPISLGLAGVSMRLRPGAIREMHWHANAAEWTYFVTGRASVAIVSPDEQWETVMCGPGDVFYVPRGYAHSIQNVSQDECHFILVFDNGYFDEFNTFSVTAWMASTPREVLAKNLGVPESALAALPDHEVYIAEGPVPPVRSLVPASVRTPGRTHQFSIMKQESDRYPGGTRRLATIENFPASATIAGGIITLAPGALRELHWHPNADEWDYFLQGRARMTVFSPQSGSEAMEFEPGDICYVPQGMGHYIENTGSDECVFLIAFNSGTYEEINLTDWIHRTPPSVVAANFGISEKEVAAYRRKTGFIDRPGARSSPARRR